MINAVLKYGLKYGKSAIARCGKTTVSKYGKKIAKYGKVAINDLKGCKNLPSDIYQGAKQASRLGRMQNQSIFRELGTQGVSLARQTNKHLPGLLVGATIPTFIPSGLAYILGKWLQKNLTKFL